MSLNEVVGVVKQGVDRGFCWIGAYDGRIVMLGGFILMTTNAVLGMDDLVMWTLGVVIWFYGLNRTGIEKLEEEFVQKTGGSGG